MKISEINYQSLPKTQKLYDDKPYDTTFEATVIYSKPDDKGSFFILLDQTLFFPEEGGQTPDKGYFEVEGDSDMVQVTDVRMHREHGADWIVHVTDRPVNPGTLIKGTIDWAHRYSNMQNHSGEHIFSGLVNKKYGYDNVGFHLSDNIVSMDYNGPLSDEEVEEIALLANQAIWDNIPIETGYPDKSLLDKLEYRSKIELEGPVRIVTIPGIDICACCAPHVRATGEIGQLIVLSRQNYKGGTRLSILCGKRAYLYNTKNRDMIGNISRLLKIPVDTVDTGVEDLQGSADAMKQKLHANAEKILRLEASAYPSSDRNMVLFTEDCDSLTMRNFVNEEKERREGYAVVFSGNDKDGYSFIAGSKTSDCQILLKEMGETLGAKGGGKAAMIQGSINCDKESILAFFKEQ